MAVTIIAQPQQIHPAYNPVVYMADSTESSIQGFRYLISLYDSSSLLISSFRVAPRPNDGYGYIDICKIIQSQLTPYIDLEATTGSCADTNTFLYDIDIDEEYSIYWAFDDHQYNPGPAFLGKVNITDTTLTNTHPYVVGDQVYIQLDSFSAPCSQYLNGYFTVLDVPDAYTVTINLNFGTCTSPPGTDIGKMYYADRRKITVPGVTIANRKTYNEAVPFVEWPAWSELDILAGLTGPTGYILTNAPDSLTTTKDKDKFIVKPYQELYWNFYDNESFDVTSVIAINNYGDRWMLKGDGCTGAMKQFPVGPSANWTSIIPQINFYNTADFLNHSATGGVLLPIQYYDIHSTYQMGYEPCDIIEVNITTTGPTPPPISANYEATCIGIGYGGRREYVFFVGTVEYRIRYSTATTEWEMLTESDGIIRATLNTTGDCPESFGGPVWTWLTALPPGFSIAVVTTVIGNSDIETLHSRRIYLDFECEINNAQLLFLDRAGSYSSFAFPLRIVESGTNAKLGYNNEIGGEANGVWTYSSSDSERTNYSSTVEKSYSLSTGWINTGMSDYFEELITSPDVYFKLESDIDTGRDGIPTSEWVACTVTDTSFINPKQKNKRLINRSVNIRLNSNNAINI
jgi:hypothetical protein